MTTILPAVLAAALIAIPCKVAAQAAVDSTPTVRWSRAADATVARQEIYPAVLDGRIIVAGGVLSQPPGFTAHVEAYEVFADAWVYDPGTDRWLALPAMPTPRHGHGAAVVGNRLFLIGGGEKVGVAASRVQEVLEIPAR